MECYQTTAFYVKVTTGLEELEAFTLGNRCWDIHVVLDQGNLEKPTWPHTAHHPPVYISMSDWVRSVMRFLWTELKELGILRC